MKKLKGDFKYEEKIVTALMVAGLMAMNVVPSFAVNDELISLGESRSWVRAASAVYNPGNYSYAIAGCDIVYAKPNNDTITQIHVRIVNANTEPISASSYVALTEGTGVQRVYLKEGHISDTPLFFEFRGTTSDKAYAVVDYYTN